MTGIPAHLPHRYPFLLVDRILEREPGVRVLAEKQVTAQEPFTRGHFPGRPQVPAMLMLEMLAQAAGFLEANSLHGAALFLAGIKEARFLAPAFPGDCLRLDARQAGSFAGLIKITGTVSCADRELCTATLLVKRL
jgi:3-hydroxymyristoyl/3-hydroxydecanoyl-(acyl carrier protein) dehydratase